MLAAAFDSAWIEINARRAIDPLVASGSRERLGAIIVSEWRANPEQDLVAVAVERFMSTEATIPPAKASKRLPAS